MACRVVVLVSGTGTLLQSLIDASNTDELDAEIVGVVADRGAILALERAERAGIPTVVHPLAKGSDRAAWDQELTERVLDLRPDLVVSAGFMKLVGKSFWLPSGPDHQHHPALLPSFPGMHGPRDALAYGVKITGATIFAVDEGVDSGRILAQEAVAVRDDDTVETLHDRIKVVEQRLLVQTVRDWPTGP